MNRSYTATSRDSDGRLQAAALILAEGILRRRLRQFGQKSRHSGAAENPLELVPRSSAHVAGESRTGEAK
jgi:hypothetical protein